MNLIPQGNRVLIRPDGDNAKSTIFIPEAFRRAADRGTVVSVGTGKRHFDGKVYPPSAKPGDRVIFSLTQIMRFEENGEKFAVMDEDAILVFLQSDAKESKFVGLCDKMSAGDMKALENHLAKPEK